MLKRAFGDLENYILAVVKSCERVTVKDVVKALGNTDKYTTIMTVMNRLVDKKLLGRQKVGLRFEYWTIKEERNTRSIFERLKNKLFGLKTADVVSCLLSEAEDLSHEDLEEVEKIILEAKKKKLK